MRNSAKREQWPEARNKMQRDATQTVIAQAVEEKAAALGKSNTETLKLSAATRQQIGKQLIDAQRSKTTP